MDTNDIVDKFDVNGTLEMRIIENLIDETYSAMDDYYLNQTEFKTHADLFKNDSIFQGMGAAIWLLKRELGCCPRNKDKILDYMRKCLHYKQSIQEMMGDKL